MRNRLRIFFKRIPFVVFIIRRVRALLRPEHFLSLTDASYFERAFQRDPNFLSFDCSVGVGVGRYGDYNFLFKIRPRNAIECQTLIYGVRERHVLRIVNPALSNSKVMMIDVGANVGTISIPLAVANPNSEFLLFEANPDVFADLNDNISFNKLENLKAFKVAVTDSDVAEVDFYSQVSADNLGLSSLNPNPDIERFNKIRVSCRSLDSFLPEISTPVRLIKIDTQGSELSVLKSGIKLIQRYRPIIIFEYESQYLQDSADESAVRAEIASLFQGLNYKLFVLIDGSDYLPALNLESRGAFSGDILALPAAVE